MRGPKVLLTALALACLVSREGVCEDSARPPSAAPGDLRVRDATDPRPHDAVRSIIEAFARHPIVALGEAHALREQHEFIAKLIRHPDFASGVDDIVVEFGSAAHQDVLDRFLGGADVPEVELRRVWRDTSQPLVWDAPVYERFFATVCTVNRGLPAGRRLRVLLGDPPLDWQQVRTREDYHRLRPVGRNESMMSLLSTEVLARGRKALLIAGTAHVRRRPGQAAGISLVERRHPGSVFVVVPHLGLEDSSPALHERFERTFAGWPRPSIALVEGTSLGAVPWRDWKLEDETDAYLYLGPLDTLTMSRPSPEIYRDEGYFRELDRRHRILTGRPLDRASLLRERPARFVEQ
jgi:hypothetical protein